MKEIRLKREVTVVVEQECYLDVPQDWQLAPERDGVFPNEDREDQLNEMAAEANTWEETTLDVIDAGAWNVVSIRQVQT